jgi:adenosine deaminase
LFTDDTLRRTPKALLHDHLDGGLRPQTILELADAVGYQGLPAREADALGAWFRNSADSGSLQRYLDTFAQTLAVMQTVDGLHRVASECVQDLAADGVVYAEVRYAPEQHLVDGLALQEVVEAVNAGFRDGERAAAVSGHRIRVTVLLTAMRHAANGTEIARLVVRYRDDGVAGFDIAGAEAGFPPTRHLDAFELLRRENAHFTIHAGEAFGLPSIWEAIQWCGADRLGHGVRIVDDVRVAAGPAGTSRVSENAEGVAYPATADPTEVTLGRLASYVRDRRIPLEMCPSSNVQTGAAESIALHPISLLKRLKFRVTVNTDNRLMSGTSMTREMSLLVNDAGWTVEDLRWVTINAMKSAFIPFDERLTIIEDVIKPGYAALIQA